MSRRRPSQLHLVGAKNNCDSKLVLLWLLLRMEALLFLLRLYRFIPFELSPFAHCRMPSFALAVILQLQLFLRDNSTGRLSFSIAASIGAYIPSSKGQIASLAVSEAKRRVIVAMSNGDSGATESLVALHTEVRHPLLYESWVPRRNPTNALPYVLGPFESVRSLRISSTASSWRLWRRLPQLWTELNIRATSTSDTTRHALRRL